ncbi:glucose-6-phosphate isomerase [Alisedimentitalea sp. MJ-SS2]|uniref:glucose-6-phosphate isomerase n=1 Tax=Aliisedimentitalea sp. MJ-SS2 TaxID=3049795 RepID=UPI002913B82B|nr:glucose-6-phosphate isomerase [Alisedimentitalea sp. MJ-SS2]MDU8929091.1 glucose-6-phosphate isomerase [Alisedimentitalea sp. MJ-SS2]
MRKSTLTLAAISALALSACNMSTYEQQQLGGAAAGAAIGLVGANILGANTNWKIIATLAGAAAGAHVATNQKTGECAYANGDGTYTTRPCD